MNQHIVITGANRGIGLEFVRQYLARGADVTATCRNPAAAQALNDLAERAEGRLHIAALEVTDQQDIDKLAKSLADQPISALINNAGVYGPKGSTTDPAAWAEVFAVNTIAPMRVTQALQDNLRAADRAVVASITSRMGSIADNSSGGSYVYRSSKAALNAAMHAYALDVANDGVIVLLLHPGWVKTDMGGDNALIDARTSVTGLRRVIESADAGKSGYFFAYDGAAIDW